GGIQVVHDVIGELDDLNIDATISNAPHFARMLFRQLRAGDDHGFPGSVISPGSEAIEVIAHKGVAILATASRHKNHAVTLGKMQLLPNCRAILCAAVASQVTTEMHSFS